MPNVPDIDIKELKKMGALDEDKFFRLLSDQNNYVDIDVVKDFYMGLVRVVTQELRQNGVVRLPCMGDFALVKQREGFGWMGKKQGVFNGMYVLRFYALNAWRLYFKKLAKKPGRAGRLDPRERLLNQNLDEYKVETE